MISIDKLEAPASRAAMEPRIQQILDDKLARRRLGPYRALSVEDISGKIASLLAANGWSGVRLENLTRMPGGGSKEQFWFDLVSEAGVERLILRMDPREGIVETCRTREAEIIRAMDGYVPVAPLRILDGQGAHLGQPGAISSLVRGVSKPPVDNDASITGVGTSFSLAWRKRLIGPFVEHLTRIHAFDWRQAHLPHFQAPVAHPAQAAEWQVNWWARVWRDDRVDPQPLLTLAERWLRERLPACEEWVMVHGDYRTSNFMFDTETGNFTAILDWELAHIGDFHEDLAWTLHKLFASTGEDGASLVVGLMSREDFLTRYEAGSGRRINRKTLAFYEVLASYKLATMTLGTCMGVSERQLSHQDVVLTYLSAVGHLSLSELAAAMRYEASL